MVFFGGVAVGPRNAQLSFLKKGRAVGVLTPWAAGGNLTLSTPDIGVWGRLGPPTILQKHKREESPEGQGLHMGYGTIIEQKETH